MGIKYTVEGYPFYEPDDIGSFNRLYPQHPQTNDVQELINYSSRLPVEGPQQQYQTPNDIQELANYASKLPVEIYKDADRYQMWPEKIVRSATTLIPDISSGAVLTGPGLRREDYTDLPIPVEHGPGTHPGIFGNTFFRPKHAEPLDPLMERTQDIAGVATGGPIASKPGTATLGSGMSRKMNVNEIPEYLYHATYEPYVKNIENEGLKGGKNKNWEDSKDVVYLSRNPENARSYAETSDVVPEQYLDKIVVYKIPTEKLDKSKLQIDRNVQDNVGDTLEYNGNIKDFKVVSQPKLTPVDYNPFVTDVYHGTKQPGFDKFAKPEAGQYMSDRALGTHVSKDPNIAGTFPTINHGRQAQGGVYALKIPDDKKFFEVKQDLLPYIEDKTTIKTSKNVSSDQSSIEQAIYSHAYKNDSAMFVRFLEQRWNMKGNDAKKAANDILAGKPYQDGLIGRPDRPIKGLDDYINYDGVVKAWNEADRAKAVEMFRKDLQDKGYVGIKYINTSPMETVAAKDPTSYIVFDPSQHIKSKYTNTLMSDTGKPAASIQAIKNQISELQIKLIADKKAGKDISGLQSELRELRGKLETPAKAIVDVKPNIKPNEQGFVHGVDKALTQSEMKTGTSEQWTNELKRYGVSKEELEWSVKELPKGQLTRQQVEQHIGENKVELKENWKGGNDKGWLDRGEDFTPTKFNTPNYNLPGASNYRELVVSLPNDPSVLLKTHGQLLNERDKILGTIKRKLTDEERIERHNIYSLPEKVRTAEQQKRMENLDNKFDGGLANVNERIRENQSKLDELEKSSFKSSHWDEPNPLYHIRMNNRDVSEPGYRIQNIKSGNVSKTFPTYDEALKYANNLPESVKKNIQINEGINPIKTLHAEEFQSDWHQKGRKEGYKSNEKDAKNINESVKSGKLTQKEADEWFELDNKFRKTAVPNAPFKETWHELALKKLIVQAVKEGKDAISWTPGEAQALRYANELRRTVKSISWDSPENVKLDTKFDMQTGARDKPRTNSEGLKYVSATPKEGGADMLFTVNKEGKIIEASINDAKGQHLSKVVGKPMSAKILNDKDGKFEGKDFVIGAEEMKAFYDVMQVDKANSIGKKYGAKVEEKNLPYKPTKEQNKELWGTLELDEIERIVKSTKGEPVWLMKITPEMKKAVEEKGFSLFSAGVPVLVPVDGNPFDKKQLKFTPVQHNPWSHK